MLLFLASIGLLGGLLVFDVGSDDTSDHSEGDSTNTATDTGDEIVPITDIIDYGSDDILSEDGLSSDGIELPENDVEGHIGSDPEPADTEEPVQENVDVIDQTLVSGTDSHDVLSGANVHIDISSGVVQLADNGTAEHFEGGEGDDCILLGEGDSGLGGAGADEFIVDGEIEGDGIPYIHDFTLKEDTLHISLPSSEVDLEETWPERPEFTGEVEVKYTDDTTTILINGKVVCELEGLHDIGPEDLVVSYDYHSVVPTDFDTTYGY